MIHQSRRAFLFVSVASAALSALSVKAQSPHTRDHRFGDAEKWAQVFDDPQRDAWQKPHEVIQALALEPNAMITDMARTQN